MLTNRLRIMLVFGLHATVVGSLFSRIAELQRDLGLSEEAFGVVLTGAPIGVVTGSVLISRVIEALGSRRTMMIFMPLFPLPLLLAAVASGPGMLFAALMLFGGALSGGNIAMNVEADRIEAQDGKRILNKCHGTWGLGFLIVSSLGAAAIRLGVPPLVHFLILLVLLLLATATIIRGVVDAPPRQHAGGGAARKFALPNSGTMLIVGFALTGIILEGAGRNWGVIYLRDGFGASDWHAALALPAMMATQTIGRFLGDGWVTRFGDVAVARALTCIALLGLLLITGTQVTAVALLGFAFIGLGISTVFPQAISAAAQRGDRPAAENVAAFSTLQTIASFAVPPLIGFAAAELGLRLALALMLPVPLISIYFAKYLARAKP